MRKPISTEMAREDARMHKNGTTKPGKKWSK